MSDIRPTEISMWMKNHRRWTDIPIKDVNVFSKAWWVWWTSLQPETRISDDGTMAAPSVGMDWTNLRKPGKNGLLLIMLALSWWGSASGNDNCWKSAVAEVCAVICCFGTRDQASTSGGRSEGRNVAEQSTRKRAKSGDQRSRDEGTSKRAKRTRY